MWKILVGIRRNKLAIAVLLTVCLLVMFVACTQAETQLVPPQSPTPSPTAGATSVPPLTIEASPTPGRTQAPADLGPEDAVAIFSDSVSRMREVGNIHFEMDLTTRTPLDEEYIETRLHFEGDFQGPDRIRGTASTTFRQLELTSEIISIADAVYLLHPVTLSYESVETLSIPFGGPRGFISVDPAAFGRTLRLAGESTYQRRTGVSTERGSIASGAQRAGARRRTDS